MSDEESPLERSETIGSSSEEAPIARRTREDLYVCLAEEKDLRHYLNVQVKAQYYTGILIRTKNLTPQAIENVTRAFDLDCDLAKKNIGAVEFYSQQVEGKPNRLLNMKLEETRITKRTCHALSFWMKKTSYLNSFGLMKTKFEDPNDFKLLMDAIAFNKKLQKLQISHMMFDSDHQGRSLGQAIGMSGSLKEVAIEFVDFQHPTSFYQTCLPLMKKSRIVNLRIRGVLFTTLESKTLQLILMNNKQLHTLDFSECIDDSRQTFAIFMQKFNNFCNVRVMTMDNMVPDLSNCIVELGEALKVNKKLGELSMRNNKIKAGVYGTFFLTLCGNKSLKKLNVSKTDLNDKVVQSLVEFMQEGTTRINDLDLSRNLISDTGLKMLANGFHDNKSLVRLNLEMNLLKGEGFMHLADYLVCNKSLTWLNLSGNRINNEGLVHLSSFLERNETLTHLDISKNSFSDAGFDVFAQHMARSAGLTHLDISRNRDINEVSLITLAIALSKNQKLYWLNLSQLKLTKNFLKNYLEVALSTNITLAQIIGKYPEGMLQVQLDINQMIRDEIYPCFKEKPKIRKNMPFNFTLVDSENYSFLDISGKPYTFIEPAFKFITFHDVRAIDFSGTEFGNKEVEMLCTYLDQTPSLYSITLDHNPFTDQALLHLCETLKTNEIMCHLSFKACEELTDHGLRELLEVISFYNMVLFQINLDREQFDTEMADNLVEMSFLNRSIQQHLKPKLVINCEHEKLGHLGSTVQQNISNSEYEEMGIITAQSMSISVDHDELTYSREVRFLEGAPVAEHFQAVLKVYCILQPDVIELVGKDLQDVHFMELVGFMKNKEMIRKINVRRNKISNQGAIVLADFLVHHDNTMVKFDLTRNRIGRNGAEALVDAVHGSIRITDVLIDFGNRVPVEIARAFELELKANLQIKENLCHDLGYKFRTIKDVQCDKEASNRYRKTKKEISDVGEDHIRCAVKTSMMLNILHLSLPDNLLGGQNAKLLSNMLMKNPQLRILNLSKNCFGHSCATLFGEALRVNDQLKSFDISSNRLGDLGVRNLTLPLINDGLKDKMSMNRANVSKLRALAEKERIQKLNKNFQQKQDLMSVKPQNSVQFAARRKLLEAKIEDDQEEEDTRNQKDESQNSITRAMKKSLFKATTQLEALNLSDNYMTQESLRHVWFLLNVKPTLCIGISEPDKFNWNQKVEYVEGEKTGPVRPHENFDSDLSSMDMNSVFQLDGDEGFSMDPPDKFRQCLKKVSCFQDFNNIYRDEPPNCWEICCWRYYRTRQEAMIFETSENIGVQLETQKCLTYHMFINQILFLLCCAVPYFAAIFTGGKGIKVYEETCTTAQLIEFPVLYLVYSTIFEISITLKLSKQLNFKNNCSFLTMKIFSGTFNKLVQFTQVQISALLMTQPKKIGKVLSFILTANLCLAQYSSFKTMIHSLKIKHRNVLTTIEKNQLMAKAAGYQAIYILFFKVSIEENDEISRQSRRLEVFLPNMKRDMNTAYEEQFFYKAEAAENFLGKINKTPFFLFSTLPMIVAGCLCYFLAKQYCVVLLTVGFISFVKETLEQCHDNPIVIIDPVKVHKKLKERIKNNQDLYDNHIGPNAKVIDDEVESPQQRILKLRELVKKKREETCCVPKLIGMPCATAVIHQNTPRTERPLKDTEPDYLGNERPTFHQPESPSLDPKSNEIISMTISDEGTAPLFNTLVKSNNLLTSVVDKQIEHLEDRVNFQATMLALERISQCPERQDCKDATCKLIHEWV